MTGQMQSSREMGNQNHSGTCEPSISERERKHGRLAKNLAAEGMVLLKNEGLLPLKPSMAVALLGGGAAKTVKGGIGSGDVNNRESISIYQGMEEAGVTVTSRDWLEDFCNRYQDARTKWKEKILEDTRHMDNPFDAYAANPFSLPEGRTIVKEDLKGAQAAIYVISRISGEGKDRRRVEGDYYLSKKEREDLLYLNQQKIPVVLILNVGAPVELTELLDEAECIRAILHICLPGQEGGRAVADVLLGRAAPGGRLTDTWAKHYEDYPSSDSYGYLNGNLQTEEYREGIYVGYRYFGSFGIEPLFPFGYGLSYTDFSIRYEKIQVVKNGVEVTVTVENIGEYHEGREVVQVYVTLPQTGMAKEYQRLAGFAKTRVLCPKEVQRLTVFLEQKQMASYSEDKCAWVIENGKYGVWVGKNSVCLELVALLEVEKEAVIEWTKTVCPLRADFQDVGPAAFAVERAEKWQKAAKEQGIVMVPFVPCEEMKEYDEERGCEERQNCRTESIRKDEKTQKKARDMDDLLLARELPVEDLIPLLYGNITDSKSVLGSAGVRVPGSAGETTEALEKTWGVCSLIMADGPAGLRLRQSYQVDRQTDTVYGSSVLGSLENGFLEKVVWHEKADTYYQYCTAFPVGTALAQTWDEERMKVFGSAIAAEMEEFHVNLWLAPGINIHRNPLCGRNFEYYSEDPYLSGVMAAAVIRGVQGHKGCGATIKHFACNNQEDNRMSVDSCVSGRAFREIYLRGFEVAVKRSMPVAIMSSYNRINGIHAANSYDLCTVLAREEWGFDGVIMSDWNTTVPQDGSIPWMCAEAGNDIIMPGNPQDVENIYQAYKLGKLSEKKIRDCAGRVLRMVQRLKDDSL